MANKFSAIVLNEVINSAQVPGANIILKIIIKKKYGYYRISQMK